VANFATVLDERKEYIARIMTEEMGKPITGTRGEVGKCAELCRYLAQNSEAYLKKLEIQVPNGRCYVTFEPLGPIYMIMPFNFPAWMPIKTGV
jgi:succinate-semialdehyde dehydrogenase/glutarate-semialdehyde dehydrogenase